MATHVFNFLWLCLKIYLWTILSACAVSITLAAVNRTLRIRQCLIAGILRVFEYVSEHVTCVVRDEDVTSDNDDPSQCQDSYVIQRDASKKIFRKMSESPVYGQVLTILDDSLDFVKAGVECVIEDDVTKRFDQGQLRAWNLLTRTKSGYEHYDWWVSYLYIAGFIIRYFFFFPIRLVIFLCSFFLLVFTAFTISFVQNEKLKRKLNLYFSCVSYRISARALSIVAKYHNRENRAKPGGICVANHTSLMDIQVLSMDNCYAFVGQKHPGYLGWVQNVLSRARKHVWFERCEANDRLNVRTRLTDHVADGQNFPILIFPEGTCINNTSLMMFKKGSFEIDGAVIYPVALKYDPRLGDAFWNSSKQSYLFYLFTLMTSWATVVDVWYLEPTSKRPDEDGIKFAARVKKSIAQVGGFKELDWDGQLKRYPVKKEALEKQRERWSRRVQKAPETKVISE